MIVNGPVAATAPNRARSAGPSRAAAALAGLLSCSLAGTLSGQSPCAIQGNGPASGLQGGRVTTSGVVTADFTSASLAGFFLLDPNCDTDSSTSNGLFVSTGTRRPAVSVGHRVTVVGRVVESSSMTTVELESVTDGGAFPGVLEVPSLDLPTDPAAVAAYLEAREGMLVAPPKLRVVAATNHFGEAYALPDSAGVARLYRGADDARKLVLSSPTGWLALDQSDRVSDLIGVLGFTFSEFKLFLPQGRTPVIERSGIQPPSSSAASGDPLLIGFWNLENLFDPVDDPGQDDAPSTPSAADYSAGLARRARSIARSLGLPDVLGVAEAEKIEVLQDLANQPELVGARYRSLLVEGPDSRGIDVGLLYNSDRLDLRSFEARPACTSSDVGQGACPNGSGFALFARPPLVAQLTVKATGEHLSVVVNHFRAQEADSTADDGVRAAQADAVRTLAGELKSADPTTSVIVLGDLNDFEDSETLRRLVSDGRLVDLTSRASGGRAYSYAYQGLCQVLDYVLVESSLAGRVADYAPSHANVDFSAIGPGFDGPHASDHDAVLLKLRLR